MSWDRSVKHLLGLDKVLGVLGVSGSGLRRLAIVIMVSEAREMAESALAEALPRSMCGVLRVRPSAWRRPWP